VESFGRAFLKARGFSGQSPESLSAESETLFSAFLFVSFFFAPPACKEKAENSFAE
jgi:hypothetical protein